MKRAGCGKASIVSNGKGGNCRVRSGTAPRADVREPQTSPGGGALAPMRTVGQADAVT